MLPANTVDKTLIVKVSALLQPVVVFLRVKVKVCVPVLPVGMDTGRGDVVKEALVTATKSGIVELKLYWSTVPVLMVYGKLKLVAEAQKASIVPTVKTIPDSTVTVTAELAMLVQPEDIQVAV